MVNSRQTIFLWSLIYNSGRFHACLKTITCTQMLVDMRNFKSKTYLLLALMLPICVAMIARYGEEGDPAMMKATLDEQGQVMI